MEIFSNSYKRILILSLVIIAAYYPVLFSYKTASPDASLILGVFESTSGLWEYLTKLFTLKTMDFQPVRDLSLWIDWFIFKHLNVNTFIIQNAIVWIGICCVTLRLLRKIYNLSIERLFPFVLAYSVYPLFCSVLSWSMARKHLLAFLFILLATEKFIDYLQHNKKKDIWLVNLFYLLALLSQPIGILWPLWAAFYAWSQKKLKISSTLSLFFILVSVAVVNFIYYKESPVFTAIFESKTEDAFQLADKILALGHYFYQLFVPYYQTFFYDLGHWSIWVGLLIAASFYMLYSFLKLPKKELALWSLFAFLPILVILNTPNTKSDTYLLLPSFALLVLMVRMLEPHLKKSFLLIPVLWIVFINVESRMWTDSRKFAHERNFQRRPTCVSAVMAAKADYANGVTPPTDVIQYFRDYECLRNSSDFEVVDSLVLNSNFIYYSPLPMSQKITTLENLQKIHWYPKLILAALYFQSDRQGEALGLMHDLNRDFGSLTGETSLIPPVANVIHPACEKLQDKSCLNISSRFSVRKKKPYF